MRAARAHSEMSKRSRDLTEEAEYETPKGIITRTKKLSVTREKESEDSASAELKLIDSALGHLDRINVILTLSMLLGDVSLTDQQRKAIGITISVVGKTNAA
jgi:hypothetical protein